MRISKRYNMEPQIIVKQLFRDSIEDQVSVLLAFNPNQDRGQCLKEWENKQYKNPLGNSIIFGAYFNGKLVGMNAYMPVEYNFKEKKIAMVQSCDSKVLEECRGHGIWSKIVRAAVDYIFNHTEYAAIIGFPNYRNSYPGFIKMKWQTLEQMSNYVLVNKPSVFSKMLFKKNRVKQLLGRAAGFQRLIVSLTMTGGYQVTSCTFDELLWDDDENCMCVSHTYDLLEWKQLYKSIKTIGIKKDGKVVGSCIYSFDTFEGYPVCRIEKFVTGNSPMCQKRRMFALVLKYIRYNEPQAAIVRVWTMAGSELELLCRKTLFGKSNHPNPFIIKQPSDKFNDTKWNLSFFDLD